MNEKPVSAHNRPSARRVAAGLLAGISWMVTLEFLFGFASALSGGQPGATRLLALAAASGAVSVLLLFSRRLFPSPQGGIREAKRPADGAIVEARPARAAPAVAEPALQLAKSSAGAPPGD